MASIRRPMLGFTSPLDTFSMLNMFVWEKSGDFSFLGLLKSDINKIIKVKFWNDVGTAVGLILDQTKAQSIYTPESTYLVELRMFALLSGLWKYLFQKDEYCILILGLDNAGKSVSWDGFIFGLTITLIIRTSVWWVRSSQPIFSEITCLLKMDHFRRSGGSAFSEF